MFFVVEIRQCHTQIVGLFFGDQEVCNLYQVQKIKKPPFVTLIFRCLFLHFFDALFCLNKYFYIIYII